MRRIFNPQKEMGYRFMVWGFKIMDLFGKPDRRLNDFDIMQGSVVCGLRVAVPADTFRKRPNWSVPQDGFMRWTSAGWPLISSEKK